LRSDLRIPKALTGVEEVLRWTRNVSTGENRGRGGTLKSGFDHVQRMDDEGGCCASCEAGNGLDQRGREPRMGVTHEGVIGFVML
jgi:hypothetical protein